MCEKLSSVSRAAGKFSDPLLLSHSVPSRPSAQGLKAPDGHRLEGVLQISQFQSSQFSVFNALSAVNSLFPNCVQSVNLFTDGFRSRI